MLGASWLLAQSRVVRPSFSDWCMPWQEKHESLRESLRALTKHGESIRPLYSRPETRTIPSGQNESLMNCGSLAIMALIAGEGVAFAGWTTMRLAVNSSPGLYGSPAALA